MRWIGLGAVVIFLLVAACGDGEPDDGSTATTVTDPIPAPTAEVTSVVPVGDFPVEVGLGAGSVWVTNAGDSTVARIDPATDEVVATVPVGSNPDGLAVSPDAVWTANRDDGTVSRIEVGTNEVTATIPVGEQPSQVAVGDGGVWVANDREGSLTHIDPATDEVVATVFVNERGEPPLPGPGRQPTDVTTVGTSVWAANPLDGTVVEVDATTDEVSRTIDLSAEGVPLALAVDGSDLWVLTESGGSALLSAETGEVVEAFAGSVEATAFAVGDGTLWGASVFDGVVAVGDPTSGEPARLVDVDSPVSVDVDAGTAWVANRDANTVTRLDLG